MLTLQRATNWTALPTSIPDQSSSIEQMAKAQNVRRRSLSEDIVPMGRGEKLFLESKGDSTSQDRGLDRPSVFMLSRAEKFNEAVAVKLGEVISQYGQ
jgi:hypothetical protein